MSACNIFALPPSSKKQELSICRQGLKAIREYVWLPLILRMGLSRNENSKSVIQLRLYENEAKKIFEQMGIPIPKQFGLISSADELDKLQIEIPLIVKSMVLVGGRGKAGGIRKAESI
ncbi:MAG: ATP-grasp domain-containing protein, partial [Candidatus Hodarchaeota archaeon]